MTPVRVKYFKLAHRRLAQCRRAVQLLMDVQGDDLAAAQLRAEFRDLNDALNDFARYQCGIRAQLRKRPEPL